MRHTIVAKEPVGTAEIVWDDVAGTVAGNHSMAPELARAVADAPMRAYCPWGSVSLRNPAHDASDFLTALRYVLTWPLDIDLPATLADVDPTPYPPAPGGAMGDVVGPP